MSALLDFCREALSGNLVGLRSPLEPGVYWIERYGKHRTVQVWRYDTGPELFTAEGGVPVTHEAYQGVTWYGPVGNLNLGDRRAL